MTINARSHTHPVGLLPWAEVLGLYDHQRKVDYTPATMLNPYSINKGLYNSDDTYVPPYQPEIMYNSDDTYVPPY